MLTCLRLFTLVLACIVRDMYRAGMDITEAGEALDGWKQRREHLEAERDQLIRDTAAAGMPIRQIHLRSGIGRSTIYRVLGVEGDGPPGS